MLRRLWPTGNLVVSAAMFRQLVQQSALAATFQGYGCQYKWSIFEWMEAFINDINVHQITANLHQFINPRSLVATSWIKGLVPKQQLGILSKHRNYMFICADGLGRCLVCSPVAGGMWRTGQRRIRCPPIDMNKWLAMNNKQLVKDQRRLCRGPNGRHASG